MASPSFLCEDARLPERVRTLQRVFREEKANSSQPALRRAETACLCFWGFAVLVSAPTTTAAINDASKTMRQATWGALAESSRDPPEGETMCLFFFLPHRIVVLPAITRRLRRRLPDRVSGAQCNGGASVP